MPRRIRLIRKPRRVIVATIPGRLSAQEATAIRERWIADFGRRKKLAILPEGATVTEVDA